MIKKISELSGLAQDKDYPLYTGETIAAYFKASRLELKLSVSEVAFLTELDERYVEKAEEAHTIPRYAQYILLNFYDYLTSYAMLVNQL